MTRNHPRSSPRTLRSLLLGGLLAGGLLAACGGGSSGTPKQPTPPAGSGAGSAGSGAGSAGSAAATPGAGTAAGDPKRRLTRPECTEAVDHAIALFTADPSMADAVATLRDHHDEMVTQCEQKGTLRDYRCLMDSKTTQDLGKCPEPGDE